MKRRTFFRRLLGSFGAAVTGAAPDAAPRRVLIQECRLAGFQFHAGAAVWPRLSVGVELRLVREPDNPHDAAAVGVYFHERQIGYVPRSENRAVAQLLDRGERLVAVVSGLTVSGDPWERLRLSISLST